MNKILKTTAGVAAFAGLSFFITRFIRKNTKNTFSAPDGNSYKKDQIYRDAHGKLFRNGKEIHPALPPENISHQTVTSNHTNEQSNYTHPIIGQPYHHKGKRHT